MIMMMKLYYFLMPSSSFSFVDSTFESNNVLYRSNLEFLHVQKFPFLINKNRDIPEREKKRSI